ncbi:hypothetical protein [Halobaculum sp. EA56]|uniref:hypothetical protein n=1 Tax=Halobaculum sp. EA56 TaxID=3421648 RepID=UPI003EC13D57
MYAPGPRPSAEPHAHRHPRSLTAAVALALLPAALLVAASFPSLTLGALLGAALPRVAAAASARVPRLVADTRTRLSA